VGNLFSQDWWLRYREAWNSSRRDRSSFGNVGSIGIIISDLPNANVALTWDNAGSVDVAAMLGDARSVHGIPVFEAPSSIWHEFVSGEVSAARLVVRGKIRYSGSTVFLLTHGPKFDLLGLVGADMERTQRGDA